jgi:acetyltransferase-like isoleucine patch superfamily enzyme
MSTKEINEKLIREKIPVTTSNIYTGRSTLIVLFQFIFGIIVVTVVNSPLMILIIEKNAWYLLFFMPFGIYGNLWLFTFSIAGLTWFIIKLLKWIHPPQQGVFPLDSEEFKFYKRRYWASYFAIWLARALPIPWVDYVVYWMLGNKVGSYVCLYDSWVDIEFIEFGKNVMTSMNSIIMSHAIYQDKFIQLRTVLENNSIVGAQAVVAPGTILEEGGILGAGCSSYIGQHLASNVIHLGNPATKTIEQKPVLKPEEEEKNEIRNIKEDTK